RVVIGYAGPRLAVRRAARDEHVPFRPVDLEGALGEPNETSPALVGARLGSQPDGITLTYPQVSGIVAIDEHGVALRSGERVRRGEHHRVELLASSGRHVEGARLQRGRVDVGDAELTASRGGGEAASGAQVAAAPLDGVAGAFQAFHARVGRHDAGDLSPKVAIGGPGEPVGQVGPYPTGELGEDPPLAAGLPDVPGDLGAEGHPSLGGGLGAAAFLLVTGGGG